MAISQVQLSTRISYETALLLDQMSKETGQSKAGIVEAALKAYLDAQKQKGRSRHSIVYQSAPPKERSREL